MASVKSKVIHLIVINGYSRCRAACDETYLEVFPIEGIPREGYMVYKNRVKRGTHNVKRITCKRCLKTKYYKDALDKANHPLFYWKENV